MTERQEQLQIVAAFVDGERVDSETLRAALADEEGRDYLIDLVAMREIVAVAEVSPAAERSGGGSTQLAPVPRPKRFIGLAAAILAAVGLGGYAVGQQRAQMLPIAVRPPLDADIIVSVEAPPAPTHVIQLGSGASVDGGR